MRFLQYITFKVRYSKYLTLLWQRFRDHLNPNYIAKIAREKDEISNDLHNQKAHTKLYTTFQQIFHLLNCFRVTRCENKSKRGFCTLFFTRDLLNAKCKYCPIITFKTVKAEKLWGE